MKDTGAYFELTDLMGRYANCVSAGRYSQLPELFAGGAGLDLPGGVHLRGAAALREYFAEMEKEADERGSREFFAVFGPVIELAPDAEQADCLWMYLSVLPQPHTGTALHQTGRIDLSCVREGESFRIQSFRQIVRTRLEPIPLETRGKPGELYCPGPAARGMENDRQIGEALDILNIQGRYEQYLHCGAWDQVEKLFSAEPDATWTVGNTRKRYLAEHPEFSGEPDGPAYSAEPPWWMGAKVGRESIIRDGFGGMTLPFGRDNQGLYCSSDMLQTLAVVVPETGRAYTSAPSYGGFIIGPGMGMTAPYPVLNSIGRWIIEWKKETDAWKMYHFFWSTLYELPMDHYDPAHQADWLSTHPDIHDWPPLPEC